MSAQPLEWGIWECGVKPLEEAPAVHHCRSNLNSAFSPPQGFPPPDSVCSTRCAAALSCEHGGALPSCSDPQGCGCCHVGRGRAARGSVGHKDRLQVPLQHQISMHSDVVPLHWTCRRGAAGEPFVTSSLAVSTSGCFLCSFPPIAINISKTNPVAL